MIVTASGGDAGLLERVDRGGEHAVREAAVEARDDDRDRAAVAARRALEHGVAVGDVDLAGDVLDGSPSRGRPRSPRRSRPAASAANGSSESSSHGSSRLGLLGSARPPRPPQRAPAPRRASASATSVACSSSGVTESSVSSRLPRSAVIVLVRCSFAHSSSFSGSRSETEVLMVKPVSELIPLGGQIAPVLVVRDDLDRHLLDDREPEPVDAGELLRVVREDADRGQAEVGEDLVADPVVARVGGEAELRGSPRPCRAPAPAARRRAACSAGRCRGPPAPCRGSTPRPSRAIWASACSSCSPQSQRSEWKTSPVRHSEWTRTRTFSAPSTSPATSATCTLPVSFSRNAIAVNSPYAVGQPHGRRRARRASRGGAGTRRGRRP